MICDRRRALMFAFSAVSAAVCFSLSGYPGDESKETRPNLIVLQPIIENNLALFPVVTDRFFDTGRFLTLDEGIRIGKVVVTEAKPSAGLVRPRPIDPGIWEERPIPFPQVRVPQSGARVNQLALINNSDRPLILLAGEIVTGGKQDCVVGKDRIVPAHSDPVALDVFCVEPHRWTETSMRFGTSGGFMAQPSVRLKAMAEGNQQEVWNEVARSREEFALLVASPQAQALRSTSSYATTVQNDGVKRQLDTITAPLERSYEKLLQQLRAKKAVGAVVAINGQLIWADVFASSSLLDKYWPKLIRSYAAEALTPQIRPTIFKTPPSKDNAQEFLERLGGQHESIDTEPGIYRNAEIVGENFRAFSLRSLLPGTGFTVHFAKMKS